MDGPLAGSLGLVLGTGPGRGIGLLFVLMGAIKVVITLLSRLNPHLRNVEDELPEARLSFSLDGT